MAAVTSTAAAWVVDGSPSRQAAQQQQQQQQQQQLILVLLGRALGSAALASRLACYCGCRRRD
jgi:hypothetical protein